MITQTTDPASNNDTSFSTISSLIEETNIASKWNLSESQIRCLSHIIHLAVMALLNGIKAVPNVDPNNINIDADSGSLEEAEQVPAPPVAQQDNDGTVDSAVDLSSAIDKVRTFLIFQDTYLRVLIPALVPQDRETHAFIAAAYRNVAPHRPPH